MKATFDAIIQNFRNDKGGTIVALLFITFFVIGNTPDIIEGFPASWQKPVETLSLIIRGVAVTYGLYYSTKLPMKTLKDGLKQIQQEPDQKVLPPKELLESPRIKEIVAKKKVVKKTPAAKKAAKKVARKRNV